MFLMSVMEVGVILMEVAFFSDRYIGWLEVLDSVREEFLMVASWGGGHWLALSDSAMTLWSGKSIWRLVESPGSSILLLLIVTSGGGLVVVCSAVLLRSQGRGNEGLLAYPP